MPIPVTDHARDRIKERLGIRKTGAEKIAQRAWDEGLEVEQTAGKLRRYLKGKEFDMHRGHGGTIRLFNLHVWVFRGGVLVTVLHLPQAMTAAAKSCKRPSGPPTD